MSTQQVQVNLFAAARHAAGKQQVSVEAETLEDLRAALIAHSPELATIVPQCSLLIDGLSYGRGENAPIPEGARVDVLPPFSGG